MTGPNVLVTGGAGYKGALLVEGLLDRGCRVCALDNFMYGYESLLHLVRRRSLTVVQRDVRNLEPAFLKDFDVVYHLAGISGMPACAANPHAAEMINVKATRTLAGLLAPSQVMIYASTTSLYGSASEDCDEDSAFSPPSLYAMTKHEGEKAVMKRSNSIALRFATVFGVSTRMRNDLLVNDFTYRAVTERSLVLFGRSSRRTFMHIDDAIAGYLFALDHVSELSGEIINVGDERLNLSKRDIAEAIRRFVDYEIVDSTLPDLDTRDFSVSFAKARAFGFQVSLDLEDGIRDLVKLYGFYRAYSHYRVI